MNRPWHEDQVYLLDDADPRFADGERSMVELGGRRYDVPASALAAMQQILATTVAGRAVKISPLQRTVSASQAAEAMDVEIKQLEDAIAGGQLPSEPNPYITWLALSDVIAFDLEHNEPRREAGRELHRLLEEERWLAEGGGEDDRS